MKPEFSISELLTTADQKLAKAGVDTPGLDAEILLARILGQSRTHLHTWPEKMVHPDIARTFEDWVHRRSKKEPVAYILGDQEFYGHLFEVNPAVLIPRPETEHLVEKALEWVRERNILAPRILDLCTGSGCVGLTLALELPHAALTLTDLSASALEVATANRSRHSLDARVEILHGDLFDPIAPDTTFDVVVANPPYVEESFKPHMQQDVFQFEPHLALFSGADGLDLVRTMVKKAPAFLAPTALFAFEVGAGQMPQVLSLFGDECTKVGCVKDLGGHERIAFAHR